MTHRLSYVYTRLKGHIWFFLVSFLICILCSKLSYDLKHDMQQKNLSVTQDTEEMRIRYADINTQKDIISNDYPIFLEWSEKGVIGDEKRLDWLEMLERAKTTLKLPDLVYHIKAKELLNATYYDVPEDYQLYHSEMELQIGLLHEDDLFHFFSFLDQHAKGLYHVKSCRLELNETSIDFVADHANIEALCLLDWITLRRLDDDKMH